MHPEATIDEIRRLLAEGRLSQRKIAKLLGVSRDTVSSVACGRRKEWREPDVPPPYEGAVSTPVCPKTRCSLCGGMIYLPCRLCCIRAQIAQQRRFQNPRRDPRPEKRLKFRLRSKERRRYEAIHDEKVRQDKLHPGEH
ncbi:MAG: helix-turn-helix domain-containing protein [Pirellulales bacterium]|nr:helix-turn-helix domain-containing protein [Pirellulales bacterium]